MSVLGSIVSAIWGYLSSIWGVARIAFASLNLSLMTNLLELLAVVFLIYIIDGLPGRVSQIGRKVKGRIPVLEDQEEEWVLVKRFRS